MKKYWFVLMAGAIVACKEGPNPEVERLKAVRDSLVTESNTKDSTINNYLGDLNDIEQSLAEVKQKQEILTVSTKKDGELSNNQKERIAEDIQTINDLMEENKKKLNELSQKLKNSNFKISQLQKLLTKLEGQLAERDKEISGLKQQMADLNVQITNLNSNIDSLKTENSTKAKTIEDNINKLNTAYYAVGNYKELNAKKVINKEGGFLGLGKEQKLAQNFNADYFTQIDITKTLAVPVLAKKVKVITTHPSDSYKLEKNEKQMVTKLSITDPAKFWKASKYLVVVTE